jgi:hypothetical protein
MQICGPNERLRDFFVPVRLFIGSSCRFKTSVAYKLQLDLQQIY